MSVHRECVERTIGSDVIFLHATNPGHHRRIAACRSRRFPSVDGPDRNESRPPIQCRCLGGRCGRSRVGPGIRRRDVLAADLVTSSDIQPNDIREEGQNSGGDHDLSAPGPAALPLDCFAAYGGERDRWRWGGGDAGVVMPAFLERHEQEVSNRLVAPLHSLAGAMMSLTRTRAASSPKGP